MRDRKKKVERKKKKKEKAMRAADSATVSFIDPGEPSISLKAKFDVRRRKDASNRKDATPRDAQGN